MARDVVNNEYVDIRGRMHNQWVVESERLWLTERKKLEYPTFPPFPSEEEIVRRARVLENFLHEGNVGEDSQNNNIMLLKPNIDFNVNCDTNVDIYSIDSIQCESDNNKKQNKKEIIEYKTTEPKLSDESRITETKPTILGRYFRGTKTT